MNHAAGKAAGQGARGRPEVLFPLFAPLTSLPGIGPATAKALQKLGHTLPRDLLLTPPSGLVDRRPRASIRGVAPPATVTVAVTLGPPIPPRGPGRPWRVPASDGAESFDLVFFHARADWLARHLPPGERRVVSGRLDMFDGRLQMVHPDHVLTMAEAARLPPWEPVYPLGAGLGQRAMHKAVRAALARAPELPEWCDAELIARQGWPAWRAAVLALHDPGAGGEAAQRLARARLAHDELLSHQLTLALARARLRRGKGRPSRGDGSLRERVLGALPFRPTD
ncbi:MAG: ATP-dependent DNA helicase RecG, partial [Alphaproteobacteria bacterium]